MFQARLVFRRILSTKQPCFSKSLKTFLRRRQFCSSADVTSITGNTLNNAVDNHSNTADRINSSADRLNSIAIDQNSAADSEISSGNRVNERVNGNISDSDNEGVPLNHYKGNIRQHRLDKAKEFMDNLSPELIEKKKQIEAIIEGLIVSNALVPDNIDLIDWQQLLGRNATYHSIAKYCKYLFLAETSKKNDQQKKMARRLELQERNKIPMPEDQFKYNLPLFQREIVKKNWSRLRCLTSSIPMILDFNYPDCSIREKTQSMSQLSEIMRVNYTHPQPCHLHMTSAMDNDFLKEFHELNGDVLCGTVHEKPFWEVFPKDNLVYLTPDGPALKHFTGNEIFIIGGLVDIYDAAPVSYIKAKKLGIRCASLPLMEHLLRKYFPKTQEGWRGKQLAQERSRDSSFVKKIKRYEQHITY
ncbi:MRRP1-like protein [Mya arenaria]|uniref:MRRP1-like protein n=1 Tax=Mya arenaria TaxID=6604 RepID=A0ABY7F2V6_MYAAR|nr:MRRP1-like protein [Mya arenaria]